MRKERKGKVVSDKMEFTAVVEVVNLVSHPIYKKITRKKSKFIAHNPDNKAKVGDRVRIIETRPLSKTKRWRVVEILKGRETSPEDAKRSSSSAKKKGVSKPKKSSLPRRRGGQER